MVVPTEQMQEVQQCMVVVVELQVNLDLLNHLVQQALDLTV
jgi:hypothetical protein